MMQKTDKTCPELLLYSIATIIDQAVSVFDEGSPRSSQIVNKKHIAHPVPAIKTRLIAQLFHYLHLFNSRKKVERKLFLPVEHSS